MSTVWDRVAAQFVEQPARWASPLDLALALDPDVRRTPALELLNKALVDVAEGRTKRLAISLPPQEGKTSILQAFTLWLMTFRPDRQNVYASYEADVAQRTGRRLRDQIAQFDGSDGGADLGLRVRSDDRSAARWALDGHSGGLVCVGTGGALTGRKVDGALIVDDPVKGHDEAMSQAARERLWEWFRSTALTRLAPDAAVVVAGTRWHEQDLIGKLTAESPDEWRVINVPAVADSPDDPLGREVGVGMVSARGERDWDSIRRAVGDYLFAALYQGRPSPVGGNVFKRDKVRFWQPTVLTVGGHEGLLLDGREVDLADCWTFLVADLAASTKTSADYTVIATFALWVDGLDLILLDLRRERMKPSQHLEAARPMFQRWGAHTLFIESTFQSSTLVYEATRAGIPVSELKPDRDKVTRALPAAARVDQGRVWVPQGAPWVPDFLAELAAFPNGSHDDQVDCVSYAARIASTHFTPKGTPSWLAPPRSGRDTLDEQVAAALGAARGSEFDAQLDAAFGAQADRFDWDGAFW